MFSAWITLKLANICGNVQWSITHFSGLELQQILNQLDLNLLDWDQDFDSGKCTLCEYQKLFFVNLRYIFCFICFYFPIVDFIISFSVNDFGGSPSVLVAFNSI